MILINLPHCKKTENLRAELFYVQGALVGVILRNGNANCMYGPLWLGGLTEQQMKTLASEVERMVVDAMRTGYGQAQEDMRKALGL